MRSAMADKMLADARRVVADFIHAEPNQIIFTSGTTDAMNRIVNIVCKSRSIKTVAVSDIDHHSARMPWENIVRGGDAKLVKIPLTENYDIDYDNLPSADVMVITAMSNVLGFAQDVAEIIRAARRKNPNVITIVDATQYIVHKKIDVRAWDCDFLVASGHKIGADTGVGILYIRDSQKYMPDKFGGGMVLRVDDDKLFLTGAPEKFEAGTLPLTQICGLAVAIDELESHRPNLDLIKYMYDGLKKIPCIKILSSRDAAVLTFVVNGMHPLDFGTYAGANGICLRVGNMCASWICHAMGVDGAVRVSVGPWNTKSDADKFLSVVEKIVK